MDSLQSPLSPVLAECRELLTFCRTAGVHIGQYITTHVPDLKLPTLGEMDLKLNFYDLQKDLKSLQLRMRRLAGKRRLKEPVSLNRDEDEA